MFSWKRLNKKQQLKKAGFVAKPPWKLSIKRPQIKMRVFRPYRESHKHTHMQYTGTQFSLGINMVVSNMF